MALTRLLPILFLLLFFACGTSSSPDELGTTGSSTQGPNIVFIYADDLGYGDVSCYGATAIRTPHMDRIAREGIRFTNAHAASATCTPSRFSLLTGQYAWRQRGTGVAPGNASLIIDPQATTLPDVLKRAGYATGVVGKWHLGLGGPEGPDWNGEIKPGPAELGFDYSFLIPATGDRVPCVYVENGRVADLDPDDPITVSYGDPIGNWPTGKDHPEMLKQMWSQGHNQTIVNGISRIGYMTGGKSALWVDEDMADVLVAKSRNFIHEHAGGPFFLYLSTHDIHVPRVPHSRFRGKSGMGYRGDAILQLDYTVGAVLQTLDSLGLFENTLVVFTSDNGPVLDDGYVDFARDSIGDHKAAGPLRGGKYSIFDAGTRVPFMLRWPAEVPAGQVSDALLCQIDWLASFATLSGQELQAGEGPDSENTLDAFLGRSGEGRDYLVEEAIQGSLALIHDDWKYIRPHEGPKLMPWGPIIETGFNVEPQLYNLKEDIGEQENLAADHPDRVREMEDKLGQIIQAGVPD